MEILNFRRLILIIFVSGFVSSCSNEPIENPGEGDLEYSVTASAAPKKSEARIVKDHYIVLLSKRPAASDFRANAALEALTKEVGKMPNARVKNVYRSALTGFSAKLNDSQLEKLKKDDRVLEVFPDQFIELENNEFTDDPNTTNVQEYATWGLDRLDQREKMKDRAYSFSATGSGVNVYIMDSGIRYSHEEFGSRATLGVDFVKLSPDTYDEDDPNLELGNDCNGHGTHVAATVGGKLYGVAKDVNLISVRVFSCVGMTTEARVINAIEWVTNNAVKPAVVNMSLGGNAYEPLDAAIENSVASGIHYVTSAGNSSDDACNYSPARSPGAITVGASDMNDYMAYFSNFGDCVDVYAPGREITSASIKDDVSARNGNGTSMAAPHVAGLAALYLQNNPTISPAELQNEIILNSTKDVLREIPIGPNRLAYSLWEPVSFNPPTPPNLNLRVIGIEQKGSNQFYLLWDKTEDTHVEVYHNGSYIGRANNTGELSYSAKGKGSNSFKICEVNYVNCSAEVVADYSETDFVPNQPPTAAFSYVVNDLQVSFFDESTDSDGEIVKRRLYFGDGYYTTAESFVYTYREPGVYNVELFVEDDHLNSDSVTKQITVGTIVPSPEDLVLTAEGSKKRGEWRTNLTWTPAGTSLNIDIYRNGNFLRTVENTGSYHDNTGFKGDGSLEYKVCETATTNCSNSVTVQF